MKLLYKFLAAIIVLVAANLNSSAQLMDVGGGHVLYVCEDDSLVVQGSNGPGSLGLGNTVNEPVGVKNGSQATLGGVSMVAAGQAHSVVLATDSSVWAAGLNLNKQAADFNLATLPALTKIPNVSSVIHIDAGEKMSAAVQDDGTVWAWGHNAGGQLGNGTTTDNGVPQQIPGVSDGIAVACGLNHMLILRADSTVWALGSNGLGQLGNNTVGAGNQDSLPVQCLGLTGVVQIAAGVNFSMALTADGTVYTWGANDSGQLGRGSFENDIPKSLIIWIADSVIKISAYNKQAGALTKFGDLYAWGTNNANQLGVGPGQPNPITTPALTTVFHGAKLRDFAMGGNYSIGVLTDSTVVSWGSSTIGLGDVAASTSADSIYVEMADVCTIKDNGVVIDTGAAPPPPVILPTAFLDSLIPIPDTVQAEDYAEGGEGVAYHDNEPGHALGWGVPAYRTETDVEIESCNDVGNGINIGFTADGEWLMYIVDVKDTGLVNVNFRVASESAGGKIYIRMNNNPIDDSISFPATGGWQVWTTVSLTNQTLNTLGPDTVYIEYLQAGFNFNHFSYELLAVPEPPKLEAFNSTPIPVPDTVQAEDYAEGGEGLAYMDQEAGHETAGTNPVYRTEVDIEMENCSDADGGLNITNINTGEWIKYIVDFQSPGNGNVNFRVASDVAGAGGSIRITMENQGIDDTITFGSTGGLQTWVTETLSDLSFISTGPDTITLYMLDGGFNLNSFEIEYVVDTSGIVSAYKGVPISIPTDTVQAEDYGEGGMGVAYFDADTGHALGWSVPAYRVEQDVEIEDCMDIGGGINVGFTSDGEWLKYVVDVTDTGLVNLHFRVASESAGGKIEVMMTNNPIHDSISFGASGAWQDWINASLVNQTLTTLGPDTVYVHLLQGGFNFNHLVYEPIAVPEPPKLEAFNATPIPVPDTVEAEDFAEGGQSLAYNDQELDHENSETNPSYRPEIDIELENCSDVDGGLNINYINTGEWIKYIVDFENTGKGNINFRVASSVGGGGGTIRVTMENQAIDDTIVFGPTGGSQIWSTQTLSDQVYTTLGPDTVTLYFLDGGFSLNNFEIEVVPDTLQPFNGQLIAVPGYVQAEDYALGGEGVGYSDSEAGHNQGGTNAVYRVEEDVEIEACEDSLGGINVGFINEGEWLKYVVDVRDTGMGKLHLRVASDPGQWGMGGSIRVTFDNQAIDDSITFGDTGGWQTWASVTIDSVNFTQLGEDVMTVYMTDGGFNFNYTLVEINGSIGGITDQDVSLSKVYPNPFEHQLSVKLEETAQVILTGIRGEVIYNSELRPGTHKLNVNDFAPHFKGMMFMQVRFKDHTESFKLLRK